MLISTNEVSSVEIKEFKNNVLSAIGLNQEIFSVDNVETIDVNKSTKHLVQAVVAKPVSEEVMKRLFSSPFIPLSSVSTMAAVPSNNRLSTSSNNSQQVQKGAGTELKKLLSLIGIKAAPGCSCNARAHLMDLKGVEWCQNNIDMIVLWLKEEANKRKLPFVEFVVRRIVKLAINKAIKNQ